LNISSENQKVLSAAALVLSVIVLLAALGLALWPVPSPAAQINSLRKQSATAMKAGKAAKDSAAAQQTAALSQTWTGSGDEIGPTAYANLNKLASDLSIKIESFRSQRITDAGDVSQLPFLLNATGSFVNMLKFVHKIETTPTKLAVELCQFGSADESTDQVTATIGLEAYMINTSASKPSSDGKGASFSKGSKKTTKTSSKTDSKLEQTSSETSTETKTLPNRKSEVKGQPTKSQKTIQSIEISEVKNGNSKR
jgi:hypothetical protein